MQSLKITLALLPWLAAAAVPFTPGLARADPDPACVAAGQWVDPATGTSRPAAAWLRELAARPAVLLGESHDNLEHHRWQLDVLAGLHALNPTMVIGFESFPRRVQSVLDRWVAGDLSESRFLHEVEWGRVWGFAADLYLPLFHFARRHRIPMVALNVDISLIRRVRAEGWDAIPAAERRGIGDPTPADPDYLAQLRDIHAQHEQLRAARRTARGDDRTGPHGDAADGADRFDRFLAAQLLWDRAMAEAVDAARKRDAAPLVVGILGSGHLEHRRGVPHQLADLGLDGAAVLLPWSVGRPCADFGPGLADAVFGLTDPPRPSPPLKLGVYITDGEDGVNVKGVFPESTADRAGLRAEDVVLTAAGRQVRRVDDLKGVIAEMVPGVWLPLTVRRDGDTLDIVAKFPIER